MEVRQQNDPPREIPAFIRLIFVLDDMVPCIENS